jgi:biopolymer transport protein TolR
MFMHNSNNIYSQADDNQTISEINIVPLVDIMLVLLVVFMIAAPISLRSLEVNLPFSTQGTSLKEEKRVIVTLDAAGDIFIDNVKVASGELALRLKVIYESRKKKDLFIYADRQVAYGQVIKIMNASRQAGVLRMGMLTKPSVVAKNKVNSIAKSKNKN